MTKPATMGFSLDFLILEVLQPAFMGANVYPKLKRRDPVIATGSFVLAKIKEREAAHLVTFKLLRISIAVS